MNQKHARVTAANPLQGKIGVVMQESADRVVLQLDGNMLVDLPKEAVELLHEQPAVTDAACVQVKLPEGMTVVVNGQPLELAFGIARVTQELRQQLQQLFNQPLPEVQFTTQTAPGPPGAPHGVPPQCMPPASYPPAVQHNPAATHERHNQLFLARHILEVFMSMRHHQLDVASGLGGDNDEQMMPGEEWKQRVAAENAHVFDFTDNEQALYDACCRRLTAFIDGDISGV